MPPALLDYISKSDERRGWNIKKDTFQPIYDGVTAYQTNVAILKDYNGQRKKLTYCYQVRQKGICKDWESSSKKNTVNEKKLQNNLIRARNNVYELAICNEWEWFLTITLNPEKYDRDNLGKFRKDFSRFVRDYGKKHGLHIQYLVIPEQHKKGGWHMHGFLKGILPDHLRPFSAEEKLPRYLRTKVKKGLAIYDWTAYREKFGFCDIEPIRNLQAAAAYVTKYITKGFGSGVQALGNHLYYASQGLKRAKVIKKGAINPDSIYWDFENEYVKIKWYDGGQNPESLIMEDNHIKKLREQRDKLYEIQNWQSEFDTETGEIFFESPFDD